MTEVKALQSLHPAVQRTGQHSPTGPPLRQLWVQMAEGAVELHFSENQNHMDKSVEGWAEEPMPPNGDNNNSGRSARLVVVVLFSHQ